MTLPRGWTRTTLGQLGRYVNGRGFKKQEWVTSGRPIIRIQNLTGTSNAFHYYGGKNVPDGQVARAGDLLVSWAATLGAYIWQGPEAVINQHIFKVESSIDTHFHKYILDYKLKELIRETHGSGMVHITRGRFNAVPVGLPPIDEQRRIVEILEDHLSRLDAAESELRRVQDRSDALVAKTIQQELTRAAGETRLLGAVVLSLRNGIFVSRAGTTPAGVPILRISAVRPMRLAIDDLRYSARSPEELRAQDALLAPGDLLFTRYNGNADLVGACAEVPPDISQLTYPDKLIRAVADPTQILPSFLALVCNFGPGRRQIRARAKTTAGQAGISGRDLRSVQLRVPALPVQRSIVARVGTLFESGARLRAATERTGERSSALRRALLGAAFAGKLTGQGTDHESAGLASV